MKFIPAKKGGKKRQYEVLYQRTKIRYQWLSYRILFARIYFSDIFVHIILNNLSFVLRKFNTDKTVALYKWVHKAENALFLISWKKICN